MNCLRCLRTAWRRLLDRQYTEACRAFPKNHDDYDGYYCDEIVELEEIANAANEERRDAAEAEEPVIPPDIDTLLRVISELRRMRDNALMDERCKLSILVMDLERLAGLPVDEAEHKGLVSKMTNWDRCATEDYP